MRCFVGAGSNLGDRKRNLEQAGYMLKRNSFVKSLLASPIVENPALVLPDSPLEWHKPFLNAVFEFDYTGLPQELFELLKKIETEMGRDKSPRWAPRPIDLDLLFFGDFEIQMEHLRVPHAEVHNRSFVLDPLKHLAPRLKLGRNGPSALMRSRELTNPSPLWMGILNLTTDSFSDGGSLLKPEDFLRKVESYEGSGVHIFDLGAESTRPGAIPHTSEDEWRRLQGPLEILQGRWQGQIFKPKISIDTRHTKTAARAVERGAEIINDVSGLSDPALLEVLKSASCDYVLMHSLSVPADPKRVLSSEKDPIEAVRVWADSKLEVLEKSGISLNRIILDPGVGFGKTAYQSLEILKRIDELLTLPVRVLVGHSRKSFLNIWKEKKPYERDFESVGVSLAMAKKGIDILRVHEPTKHMEAFCTFQEMEMK